MEIGNGVVASERLLNNWRTESLSGNKLCCVLLNCWKGPVRVFDCSVLCVFSDDMVVKRCHVRVGTLKIFGKSDWERDHWALFISFPSIVFQRNVFLLNQGTQRSRKGSQTATTFIDFKTTNSYWFDIDFTRALNHEQWRSLVENAAPSVELNRRHCNCIKIPFVIKCSPFHDRVHIQHPE